MSAIRRYVQYFDAVISSHNIEHCDDREGVLTAMLESLKIGRKLYMSFPSKLTLSFPSRHGTLNYYDDPTHKYNPPDYEAIIKELNKKGFKILYSTMSYKPVILKLIGMIVEPISAYKGKVYIGTWEYYGFESIIIAKKISKD